MLVTGISAVLAACQRQPVPPIIVSGSDTPMSRPSATDTATATKTFISIPTETRTPTLTSTPDKIFADQRIKRKLFEAKEGEIVIVQNVAIGNIIRFPWLFGSGYLATLSADDLQGKTSQVAIILRL